MLDPGVLAGVAVAALGILLGLRVEGGSPWQILQPAAALIVLCGTCGAVLAQFPFAVVRESVAACGELFRRPADDSVERMQELLRYAAKARKRGIVSLDPDLAAISDPFTRRCLMLAIDGVPAREIEEVMDRECMRYEGVEERQARVWEAAGGFAPTMGILGAVLGLIQVMQQLDDMHQVGRGIAVAFVATLYGVGSANLLFLPVAGRLRLRQQARQQARSLTLEAVLLIAQGVGPRVLRERLNASTGLAIPALVEMAAG